MFSPRPGMKTLPKKSVFIITVLAIVFAYLLFDTKGLVQRLRFSFEKASLEKKIELLQKENASMQAEIHKLETSDQEIERIAREKYFMHRNGEKIIKVEPK